MVTKMCVCGKEFEVTEAETKWKDICYECYKKKKAQDKKDAEDVEVGTKEANEKYNVVTIGNEKMDKAKMIDPRQLSIFKGQCLNIAVQLSLKKNPEHPDTIDYIFDLAEKIYQKGIEKKYIQ